MIVNPESAAGSEPKRIEISCSGPGRSGRHPAVDVSNCGFETRRQEWGQTLSVIRQIKQLSRNVILWLYVGPLSQIIKLMPTRYVFYLGDFLGSLYYLYVRRRLLPICKELCRGSEGRAREIAVRSCRLYIKRQLEDLLVSRFSAEEARKIVSVVGIEHLDRALKRGKGVITLVSHFGSFRMILPALGYRGYRVNQLVGKAVLETVRRGKEREYSTLPVNIIRTDISIRPVINALKNNEIVVIALDGRDGEDWVKAPFLGRTANFASGPVRLAAITGAVLLPTFIVRNDDETHRMIIEKPFDLENIADKNGIVRVNMAELVKPFEKYIYDYPCHFAMTIKVHEERYEKGIHAVPFLD